MSGNAILTDYDIGKSICRRRLELGLTQEALAERIEVTYQQMQRYEYGKNRLNVESLQRIARALEVPAAYFFSEQGAKEQTQSEGLDQVEQRIVELFRGIGCSEKRALVVNVLQAFAQGGDRA